MARGVALLAAIALSLLAVSGAGGADAQTPKRGGTVVFAASQPEPACLNPLLEERCFPNNSSIPLDAIARRVVLEPFEVGPDFTWRPKLVASWSISRQPPFTLTYRIRPDARWSDGMPVTARDFVFTYETLMAHGPESDRDTHAVIRRVSAVDAKTLRIVLHSRFAGWPAFFGNILPAHALRGEDFERVWIDGITDPKTGRPIGSGPFLVERWERGRQLTLVRNGRYWGRPAHLARLGVQFGVDGSELAERLNRGQFQVAWGFPSGLARDARARGARVVIAPSANWEHLELRIGRGGSELLANKLIRRALAYGIDRVAIARQLARDTGLRHIVRDSTVFPPQSHFYAPNWSRYRVDPTQARRLLEQAGCRRGSDGIYVCAGTRLSLRFFTHVSAASIRPRLLETIQAHLRRVGVEVRPTYAPPGTVFGPAGLYARGQFDVALLAWMVGGPAWWGAKDLLGCGGPQNYTGYCQRLVTRELDQAGRILLANRQAQVLNRADRLIAADVPYIPLFQHPIWAGLASEVRAYSLHGHDALLGAENWWLDD